MKKITFILIVLIGFAIQSNAQIPNNGFENWKTVGNCIEPVGWYSFYSLLDSTGTDCPVTQSTDHYPESIGNYSVRITNDTTLWNSGTIPSSWLGWGVLSTAKLDDKPLFPITGHPTSLCGYYKFLPQNGDTMNINIYLFQNGSELFGAHLINTNSVTDWTSFTILFPNYTWADSARITLCAAAEPKDGGGVLGNSVLYVDNLSFDSLITSIPEPTTDKIPPSFTLSQNYPNPFNPETTIEFNLLKTSEVTLKIFNVIGEEVATLLSDQLPAGTYSYKWNASNVVSGVYLYRLEAKGFVETRKMIMMR